MLSQTHGTYTPATDGMTHSTYPELRGELNLDLDTIADMDRRYGVPVPVGAAVQAGSLDTCIVIGGSDVIALLLDKNGVQHAERWGALHVQASGPAFAATPATAAPQGPADPFYDIARRLAETMNDIEARLDILAAEAERDAADQMLGLSGIVATRMSYLIDAMIEQAGNTLTADAPGDRRPSTKGGAA